MADRIASSKVAHGVALSPTAHSVHKAKGTRSGVGLSLVQPGQAMAVMHPPGAQGLPAVRDAALASRSVVAQRSFQAMKPEQELQRARQMGLNLQRVRAAARAAVRGQVAKSAARKAAAHEEAEELYMGLRLAAAVLEDNVKQETSTAFLTPVAGQAQTKEELAALIEAHLAHTEDTQEDSFEELLDELGVEDPEARDELASKLRHAASTDEMMELLRDAQGLPSFGDEDSEKREDRRSEIHEAIQQFEASGNGMGQEVLLDFNIAPVTFAASDPQALKQFYKEIVAAPMSWAATLKLMAKRFLPGTAQARESVAKLKEVVGHILKALAADAQAATPSRDLRRLGAAMTQIGTMTLSHTVIEMVDELIEQLHRLPEVPHGR